MKRSLAALLLLILCAAPALADPAADAVKNAFVSFSNATSFHLSAQSQGHTVDGDFVKPDKYHMTVPPGMEMIMIGSTSYVKMNGTWRQFSIPAVAMMTAPIDHVKAMAANPQQAKVTDLGMKSVDGATLHAYSVQTNGSDLSTIYIDANGMPVRVDSNGAVVRFSNFNAPITITAPM